VIDRRQKAGTTIGGTLAFDLGAVSSHRLSGASVQRKAIAAAVGPRLSDGIAG
jgi:hypothetical protein